MAVQIRVLGCHGSESIGTAGPGGSSDNTCGFLVDGTLLLDAGTAAAKLSFDEQKRIRHVVLSHLHFDHIKGLPLLADNLGEEAAPPITVAGLAAVMAGLQTHIFNGSVYPDFFRIPSAQAPVLLPHTLEPGKPSRMGEIEVLPVLVNHTVPAAGFVVRNRQDAIVYSGDTYATDDLWAHARETPQLKAVLIECSYPNDKLELARLSKHLTPSLLAQEYLKLGRPDLPLYAYHLKPLYKSRIARELSALGIPSLHILEEGQLLTI